MPTTLRSRRAHAARCLINWYLTNYGSRLRTGCACTIRTPQAYLGETIPARHQPEPEGLHPGLDPKHRHGLLNKMFGW